jgi:hypothetical protein
LWVTGKYLSAYRVIKLPLKPHSSSRRCFILFNFIRVYKPTCYFYNKIDTITIEEVDQLARMPHSLVGSVAKKYNIAEPLEDDPLKVCIMFVWMHTSGLRPYLSILMFSLCRR